MSDEKFNVFEVVQQRIDVVGGSYPAPVTGLFLSKARAIGAAIEYLREKHPDAKWNQKKKAWLFKDNPYYHNAEVSLRYPVHCIFVLPREVTA